jgi:hypothetical protein
MHRSLPQRSTTLLVTGALVLIAAVSLVAPSSAIEQVNEKPAPLGLVGMTHEQTLRISVAYVTGFDPQPDPPGCRLQVGFVDRDGTAIGDPHIFELRPGTVRSFDLAASAIGDPNLRVNVRPVVVDLAPEEECPAVVSGELLDREGINGIIINDSVALLDPWSGK